MLAEPAVIERLRGLGSETRPTTPEGFKAQRRRRRRQMDQGGGRRENSEGVSGFDAAAHRGMEFYFRLYHTLRRCRLPRRQPPA